MRIQKILNNNVVTATDANNQELVLMGCGIAFRKRIGDTVDRRRIEKIFYPESGIRSEKLIQLFSSIPEKHISLSTEIIEYAKNNLDYQLSDNLYLTLTDHISMALERLKSGLQLKNSLLGEIERLYVDEYKVGKVAVDMMNARLGLDLNYEEAGFIALHLVNARMD